MHPKRTYFLAPTRDQAPTGPIALGNLIRSPREPDFPLNDPNSPTVRRLQSAATVVPEADATRSAHTARSLQPTVFLSFLSGLLGQNPVELSVAYSAAGGAAYRIPRLETRTIHPSAADVAALFAEPAVQAALRDSRFTANLYLVTGLQIATHGAEYLVSGARARGVRLHFLTDLITTAAGGVPVGAGVGAEATEATEGRSAGRIEGPFVLAYSLREVLYRRKKVTGQRRPRIEGDLYADGERKVRIKREEEEEEGQLESFEAELAGLKDEDPELPEYWDLIDVETGVDLDGAECQIVRVDADKDDGDDDPDED
ncbi:uncharacterized protein P884DRAFT_254062 [Thermothelomyces heterothallicus CBS 202.75]|uniref:uncharacterized protein n=1 Tax=Thermothelomyces heterothallicus CBS 202.75 TaxID=1149848 RepID=UPI0037448A33